MADEEYKDPIKLSPLAKKQLEEDPQLAADVREILAMMRQAHHAWRSGLF